MATKTVREVLIDLAKKESSDIYIAKILAYYYPKINFEDKKPLFESLMHYYSITGNEHSFDFDKILSEEQNTNVSSGINDNDYRIKHVRLADVRGIPEKDENGVPFGINFSEDSIINNAIILANNGTGKSSIFSALEMLFTQEISERKLRRRNPNSIRLEDYSNYLKRFPSERQPFCEIDTPSGKFDLVNIPFDNLQRKLIHPYNHFISDFDIYDHGQRDFDGNTENSNSFHSLIADSLGLGDFIAKQSVLKETKGYRRSTETGNLNKLEKQKEDAVRDEKNFSAQIQSKNIELKELKDAGGNTEQNPFEIKRKKLQELLAKSIYYSLNSSEFTTLLETFASTYMESQSIQSNQNEILSKNFLVSGLQLLDDLDDCPFCQNSQKTKEEIKKNVQDRVTQLQQSQKLDELLKQQYKAVTNLLSSFYKQSQALYEQINIERAEIVSYKELSSVLQKEEELYVGLSLRINDEELIEHIDNLKSKQVPTYQDYEDLYNLIVQDIIKSNDTIINNINIFIKERRVALEQTVRGLTDNNQELTTAQKIALVESEIKRLTEQVESTKKRINELNPLIEKLQKEVALGKRIKSELDWVIPLFDNEVNELINTAFDPIQEIVETILKDYLKEENLSLKISKKEKKVIIEEQEVINNIIVANLEYLDQETGEIKTVTPDIYFNTFRYKLFCLMVSLSLGLATRKEHKINLPLIIDDIFFASDFISKNSFAEFLQKVIQLFYKQTPSMPLQLILFTHDDLIFRSAIDAVDNFSFENQEKDLCDDNKLPLIEKTIIGRFFEPKDKDPTTSIFDSGEEYWNLLYCIPKNVNQLIKA
jgi:hypothetical protein